MNFREGTWFAVIFLPLKGELLGVSALTTAPIDLSNDTSPMPLDLPPVEAAESFVGNDVPWDPSWSGTWGKVSMSQTPWFQYLVV